MTLVVGNPTGTLNAVVELETVGQGPLRCQVVDVAALGPTGPAGPPGDTGPTGPTGPAGGGNVAGAIHETFSGGTSVAITAANTAAQIGDLGWNVSTSGVQAGSPSIQRIAPPTGGVGVVRIQAGTTNGAQNALYLGSSTIGTFNVANWFDFTWRVRPDSTNDGLQKTQEWGCQSQSSTFMGLVESAGWICKLNGPNSSANYQTVTSHGGVAEVKDSGVAVDANLHDFKCKRVSSSVTEFYIDGVLVQTHSTGASAPTGALLPVARAISNGAASTGFIDLDDFSFTPI